MSDDDIVELGAHEPSVESVISRLDRFQDKIKNITVIIEWKDDSGDVFHDTKDVSNLCYENKILSKYVDDCIIMRNQDD